MSAPPLITVTRQYGSGGSDVARLVAKALGWTLIDNEFVDQVARLAGLPADEVAQRDGVVVWNGDVTTRVTSDGRDPWPRAGLDPRSPDHPRR